MAVYAEYEKVRETETEVEYRFGDPELDRQLIINKRDGTCRATGGMADPTAEGLAGMLLHRGRADSTWPDQGTLMA
jgi:hypothetical protein